MLKPEDNEYVSYADRVKEIVVEFVELDKGNPFKNALVASVQRIDFTEPEALDTLAGYIEEYSMKAIQSIYPNCAKKIEYIDDNLVPTNIEIVPITHEDIEAQLIEPWASSALRKLWKAITYYEFREMWDDADGLPTVLYLLEILLISVDEEAYVPFVTDDGGHVLGGYVPG